MDRKETTKYDERAKQQHQQVTGAPGGSGNPTGPTGPVETLLRGHTGTHGGTTAPAGGTLGFGGSIASTAGGVSYGQYLPTGATRTTPSSAAFGGNTNTAYRQQHGGGGRVGSGGNLMGIFDADNNQSSTSHNRNHNHSFSSLTASSPGVGSPSIPGRTSFSLLNASPLQRSNPSMSRQGLPSHLHQLSSSSSPPSGPPPPPPSATMHTAGNNLMNDDLLRMNVNTGNDRVTLDIVNKPLISTHPALTSLTAANFTSKSSVTQPTSTNPSSSSSPFRPVVTYNQNPTPVAAVKTTTAKTTTNTSAGRSTSSGTSKNTLKGHSMSYPFAHASNVTPSMAFPSSSSSPPVSSSPLMKPAPQHDHKMSSSASKRPAASTMSTTKTKSATTSANGNDTNKNKNSNNSTKPAAVSRSTPGVSTTSSSPTSSMRAAAGGSSGGGGGGGSGGNSSSSGGGTSSAKQTTSTDAATAPSDEESAAEEAIRKTRAPLVDTYTPYIIHSDTSLEDARNRLRIALEQTRQLRAAFTERVYGKYRVCLRPPDSLQHIITRVLANPTEVSSRLQRQIKELKSEKDIEKKEAQKLNVELTAANASAEGTPIVSVNAENAEQLMYISAGLSLIILPEQDMTGLMDESVYPDRAPINPQTGQRVRSISAAAAAAGEVMLDRARKGAAMRVERQRRQLYSGDNDSEDADNDYSRLSVLSRSTAPQIIISSSTTNGSSAAAATATKKTASASSIAQSSTTKVAPTHSTKTATAAGSKSSSRPAPSSKGGGSSKLTQASSSSTLKKSPPSSSTTTSTKSSKKSPSQKNSTSRQPNAAASAKLVRARVQASMSATTLLSIHPSADELRVDNKSSAATMALLDSGVGKLHNNHASNSSSSGRSSQQTPRLKHPFPESRGAKRRTATSTTSKKESSNTASTSAAAAAAAADAAMSKLLLPPVPSARQRLAAQPIDVMEQDVATSERAKSAIANVLRHFRPEYTSNAEHRHTDDTSNDRLQDFPKRSTEISLLAGFQKFNDSAGTASNRKKGTNKKDMIDPLLALNVLKAVGLIKSSRSTSSDGESKRTMPFPSSLDMSLYEAAERRATGTEAGNQGRRSIERLKAFANTFASRKRSITEAFGVEDEKSRKAKAMELDDESTTVPARQRGLRQSVPTATIRGGGEIMMDSSEGGAGSSNHSQSSSNGQQQMNGTQQGRKPPDSVTADTLANQGGQDIQSQRIARNLAMQGQQQQAQLNSNVRPGDLTHRLVWDDNAQQSLVLLNSRLGAQEQAFGLPPGGRTGPLAQHANAAAAAAAVARIPRQLQAADTYHPHSAANALQLAHHLRHATASIARLPSHPHHSAGDIAEYIGGLHPQPSAGYEWTAIGAASAAAAVASTHNSLAALALNPHRTMVNFSVQDRARVMLAREQAVAAHAAAAHRQGLPSQQAVAFLGGAAAAAAAANHAYAPAGAAAAAQHFQHMNGQSAATAALLNSQAALMGHSGMGPVSAPNQVPSAARLTQAIQEQQQRNSHAAIAEQLSRREAHAAAAAVAAMENKSELTGSRKEHGTKKEKSRGNNNTSHTNNKEASYKNEASMIDNRNFNKTNNNNNNNNHYQNNNHHNHNQITVDDIETTKPSSTSKKRKHQDVDKKSPTSTTTGDNSNKRYSPQPRINNIPQQAKVEPWNGNVAAAAAPPAGVANTTVTTSKEDAPTSSSSRKESTGTDAATKISSERPKAKGNLKSDVDMYTPIVQEPNGAEETTVTVTSTEATTGTIPSTTLASRTSLDADIVTTKPAPIEKEAALPAAAVAAAAGIATGSGDGGLQFFVPPAPSGLSSKVAILVLAARSFEAIDLIDSGSDVSDSVSLIEYLIATGNAVPIPKAIIASLLKERLGAPNLRGTVVGIMPILAREAVVASILLWLWRHHQTIFQSAFAKSGRIDVDAQCKWIIHAAVDSAVDALSREAGASGRVGSSPLSGALTSLKAKSNAASSKSVGETDRPSATTSKLDLLITSIVSRALLKGFEVDTQTDFLLPHFNDLLKYLDETRKCALHTKSQERALLATLISRKATMSLPFSHAYASSMVRAGEAVGHGELFEIAQNEEVNASTMIPYDVFADESGFWEDPCRPLEGYTKGLTGDDLMRRAHARAMIQKSLKKIQDRHGIKGGAPNPGPYTDPQNSGSGGGSESGRSSSGSGSAATPRSWAKRRSSFSEPPIQPGTGSAAATSWSLYDPKHHSAPLVWKPDSVENHPYGVYNFGSKARSFSFSHTSGSHRHSGKTGRGRSLSRGMSITSPELKMMTVTGDPGDHRSTQEISWSDVAKIFQKVKLPDVIPQKDRGHHDSVPTPRGTKIFAPFVRRVQSPPGSDSETDSDEEEEDLTDEIVLKRHQIVLDRMKEKLSAIFETRKKTQDKRKSNREKSK